MSVIRDDLTIVDNFTSVFTKYINLGFQAAAQARTVQSANNDMMSVMSSVDEAVRQMSGSYDIMTQSGNAVRDSLYETSQAAKALGEDTSFNNYINDALSVDENINDMVNTIGTANSELLSLAGNTANRTTDTFDRLVHSGDVVKAAYDKATQAVREMSQQSFSFEDMAGGSSVMSDMVQHTAQIVKTSNMEMLDSTDNTVRQMVEYLGITAQGVDSVIKDYDTLESTVKMSLNEISASHNKFIDDISSIVTETDRMSITSVNASKKMSQGFDDSMRGMTETFNAPNQLIDPVITAFDDITQVVRTFGSDISLTLKELTGDISDITGGTEQMTLGIESSFNRAGDTISANTGVILLNKQE
jgi:hypothetical protein